jgi:uncharacterized protein
MLRRSSFAFVLLMVASTLSHDASGVDVPAVGRAIDGEVIQELKKECLRRNWGACAELGQMLYMDPARERFLYDQQSTAGILDLACENAQAIGCTYYGHFLARAGEIDDSIGKYEKGCKALNEEACMSLLALQASASRDERIGKFLEAACKDSNAACGALAIRRIAKGEINSLRDLRLTCGKGLERACGGYRYYLIVSIIAGLLGLLASGFLFWLAVRKAPQHLPSIPRAVLLAAHAQVMFGSVPNLLWPVPWFDGLSKFTMLYVSVALAWALILPAWFRKSGTKLADLFKQRPSFLGLFSALLIGNGSAILINELATVMQSLFPVPDYMPEIHMLPLFALIVVAPVFEELAFRGVVLRGFSARMGQSKAILFSSIVFSLFHINPAQLLPTFLFGIGLAWVMSRGKNLIYVICMHAWINGCWMVWEALKVSDQSVSTGRLQSVGFDLFGAVTLVGGILLFRRAHPARAGAVVSVVPPESSKGLEDRAA